MRAFIHEDCRRVPLWAGLRGRFEWRRHWDVDSKTDSTKLPSLLRFVRFHIGPQHGIDPRLIAFRLPQPVKQVRIQPDCDGLLRSG